MRSRTPSGEITLAEAEAEHVHVVREDAVSQRIDPRISPAERANDEELDTPYFRQLSDYVHHREHATVSDVEQGSYEKEKQGSLYVSQLREPLTHSS